MAVKMEVPGAPRPPQADLDGCMIGIYGDMKIGKTELANQFPGVWFVATEPGQKFLNTRKPFRVTDWQSFKDFVAWLKINRPTHFGDGEPIKFLCIDTVGWLHKFCQDAVCETMGLDDLGELDHGKGWSRLTREWDLVMNTLRGLPYGLIVIAHQRAKEFKSGGKKRDRYEPDIGASGYKWVNAHADLIIHIAVDEVAATEEDGTLTGAIETHRVMRVQPSTQAVAGGRMVKLYDMPAKIEYGYDNLIAAMQTSTTPTRKSKPTEVPNAAPVSTKRPK